MTPDIAAALRALLRATDPSEAELPEGERLAAVRPVAEKAYEAAFWTWEESSVPRFPANLNALLEMLHATAGNIVSLRTITPARATARAALADTPEFVPAAPLSHGMSVGEFISARAFRDHEYRIAAAWPAAVAAEPGLTTKEHERRMAAGEVQS